jgi:hypothetical protein
MASDPRFGFDDADPHAPDRKRSKWTTCLIGCLAVFGVILICLALVGFWIVRSWHGWAADGLSQVIEQGIDASQLPAEEKRELKIQGKRITEALRDGKLSGEQAVAMVEKLIHSPLMPAFVVLAADKQYLEKSGLSDDEKAEGRITLQRFARGTIDGKFPEQSIDSVLSHVADRRGDGNWKFRERVSDEDLRAALAEAKSHADEAGIPAEPEAFDPSDEIKKVIDEALRPKAEAE